MSGVLCVRCEAMLAVDGGLGCCAHCYWAVMAEAQEGLHLLEGYLQNWSRFADWCSARAAGE